MREGEKVVAHVKIVCVHSFTPKGRCTKFGLFQGKFRGLKTCLILGWYKFKGFKISKFNQIFDKVRLELGPAY